MSNDSSILQLDDEGRKTLRVTLEDLVPDDTVFKLNLYDLDEIATFKHKDPAYKDYRVVQCQPRSMRAQVCPQCGRRKRFNIHGYAEKDRVVHDVNVGLMQIDLVLRVPRYRCDVCPSKTFHHQFESVEANHKMTKRLCEEIQREAFTLPFSEVAAKHRISEPKVATIFDEYVRELEAEADVIVAPKVLGIDEKHIVHAMRGVLVDVESGRLLEMLPSNKRNRFTEAIEAMIGYDTRIKIVTMDMAPAYRSMIQEILPYAKIVVDKYHIFQALQQRVKPVKTRLGDMLARDLEYIEDPAEKKRLKQLLSTANKDHYLFKYGSKRLAEEAPQRLLLMAELCKEFPVYNHLRMLKEMFEGIYDAQTRQEAERRYGEWAKLVPPDGKGKAGKEALDAWQRTYGVMPELYAEFRVLRNTMENWKIEIFNYFDDGCRYTNAATEGLNNLIERINRIGNGYGFDRLRAKALYWHLVTAGVRYRLDIKKIPIYETPKDIFQVGYVDFSNVGAAMGKDKVIGTREEISIIGEFVDEDDHQPWTLFSYISKNSPWKLRGNMEYSGEGP